MTPLVSIYLLLERLLRERPRGICVHRRGPRRGVEASTHHPAVQKAHPESLPCRPIRPWGAEGWSLLHGGVLSHRPPLWNRIPSCVLESGAPMTRPLRRPSRPWRSRRCCPSTRGGPSWTPERPRSATRPLIHTTDTGPRWPLPGPRHPCLATPPWRPARTPHGEGPRGGARRAHVPGPPCRHPPGLGGEGGTLGGPSARAAAGGLAHCPAVAPPVAPPVAPRRGVARQGVGIRWTPGGPSDPQVHRPPSAEIQRRGSLLNPVDRWTLSTGV